MEKHSLHCRSIAPVRLYLEDIEGIVARLQELSPEAEYTFTTSRYEFVTLEELSGVGRQEIPELEIKCSASPRHFYDLLVSIGPESVFLCSARDTPAHRQILSQVEALLLARRRRWQWRNWLLTSAGIVGPLSAVVMMLAGSGVMSWLLYGSLVLAGISLSLSAAYLATRRWSVSRIFLVRRQEQRVHWEDVTVALVTMALVAAMALTTLLLAYLAQFLARSAN